MRYRKCAAVLAVAGVLWATGQAGSIPACAETLSPAAYADFVTAGLSEEVEESGETALFVPGWNRSGDSWCWQDQDGSLHKGWLQYDGRSYYMDENGLMVRGWREVDGEWYYFHEDGGMNLGELILDNGKYEFSGQGALLFAGWADNTGGGPYEAGCYDDTAQDLLDQLNEEKRDLYFEEHPDREDDYDGDMHRVYDRYAGFKMDMALNKAAEHRLDQAMIRGYGDESIPDEGTVNDYLSVINYRKNASCLELYVRDCGDASEAFEKIREKLDKKFQAKTDRKYSLEYYRRLGMAHREQEGGHYFMVILMR